MNKEEQRFHAAVAAMQSILPTNMAIESGLSTIAIVAVKLADALIAELNKPVKGE